MIICRFEKAEEFSLRRGAFLDDVSSRLDTFNASVTKFQEWYDVIFEMLEARDSTRFDVDDYSGKIEEIVRMRDEQRPEYEEMMQLGRQLVAQKDVTDTQGVKDTLKVKNTTIILNPRFTDILDITFKRTSLSFQFFQTLKYPLEIKIIQILQAICILLYIVETCI